MPVFELGRRLLFPPVELAEPEGILAIGGDLSTRRLLEAYRRGIFPWYDQPGGPILWWCPDPRLVLFPSEIHVSKRLDRTIRQGRFEVRFDTAFESVIEACATVYRVGEPGTWLTPEMKAAYIRLHKQGFAQCAEAWCDDRLAGGLYGVRLGRVFFGESMFHFETDASKVALVGLIERLRGEGVQVMDCQITSPHMLRFGAREIPRREFSRLLIENISVSDLADREP